ncbi:metallophosphatase [Pelagicoccus sp. SDUM812003]|uniref:metallophosphatase n=1 Tax=Pelagicoccus sp. SDUM812003 TaxID=3041267 RepID=UPI00280DCCEB|nr:metallophosphatase [Pelagicoccus sp. SDUM812003]MDQ8204137.1 metallophosphatase [Pelagicoccus sp. SDUM812003]
MNRRRFIGTAGLGLTALSGALGKVSQPRPTLTILQTNDTHSRIDPFPLDGGRNQGLGGVARRKVLIDRIREREEYTLLVDSGDMFQGTPYYNLYGGEVEIEAMNRMGYEVATVGNHEFDNGIEGLEKTMPNAAFQWVSSNLDWSGAKELAPLIKPWTIKEIGPFRVGIFGLLCQLEGMVSPANHEGVVYLDPVESARRCVSELKARGCNVIVCLSHMGYNTRYEGEEMRDDRFPAEVEGVDLILGGHSHTFLDELVELPRKGGGVTRITQQGWAGMRLGRIDVELGRGDVLAMRQQPQWVRSAMG